MSESVSTVFHALQSICAALEIDRCPLPASGKAAPCNSEKHVSQSQSVSIISSFVALISSMDSNAVMLNIFTFAIND